MYAWFLKLPRASSKARFLAIVFLFLGAFNAFHAWPDLHDDLAAARWMAWINVCGALIWSPMLLVISLGGRMPNTYARRIPGALRMSPRQLHAAIHADMVEERQRSRAL